ncbi:MAG: macro domain-containing protein [Gallionella sp.]|jgi:O-acetyl-ADP-ribose deacetylase (regulator of RNase III)|nr:macro domain-containing protein [Gallionella sp.]
MIYELSGDILLSGAKAIAQGVAPNDDFHAGLALQLREKMPALYKDFRHFCQTTHPKAGGLWTWMSADGHYIVNLFTQDAAYEHGSKPGQASVSQVNHTLHALRTLIEKEQITSVALPRLACGVGGLDWNDVLPLIEKHLGDLGIPVYLYSTYHKGVKAVEAA